MKKVSNIIWGVVLLAVGVIIALNALGLTDVSMWFDGWWTLFIIVPCTIGLFTDNDKGGNLFGIILGVLLLLASRDIISFSLLWKLLVPAILLLIGIKMIFGSFFSSKANKIFDEIKQEGGDLNVGFAAFSGNDMKFEGQKFEGADLNAYFGGVECDLRGAIIDKDCAIKATAIFGGIDIIVPQNINVKVTSNSLFGGVSNKSSHTEGAPTVYVNATCMFGGVDIK